MLDHRDYTYGMDTRSLPDSLHLWCSARVSKDIRSRRQPVDVSGQCKPMEAGATGDDDWLASGHLAGVLLSSDTAIAVRCVSTFG
jgi:hypothetical protein